MLSRISPKAGILLFPFPLRHGSSAFLSDFSHAMGSKEILTAHCCCYHYCIGRDFDYANKPFSPLQKDSQADISASTTGS